MTPNCRVIIRVWREGGDICGEVESTSIFVPELMTAIDEGRRSITDWYEDSLSMDDLRDFIHEDAEKEITEVPIIYEAVGEYSVEGRTDYHGEYDEESTFIITDWNISPDNEPRDFVF